MKYRLRKVPRNIKTRQDMRSAHWPDISQQRSRTSTLSSTQIETPPSTYNVRSLPPYLPLIRWSPLVTPQPLPSPPLLHLLTPHRKIPWRLSAPQKARQRKRLRMVDNVISTVETALAKTGQTSKPVERWKEEMPREEEMVPRDKYTVFDRKAKRYRKGIHSELCLYRRVRVPISQVVEWVVIGEIWLIRWFEQRCRSGRESARESIHLVSSEVYFGWAYLQA